MLDTAEQEQRTQLTRDTLVPSSERQADLADVLVKTAHVTGVSPGQSNLISASQTENILQRPPWCQERNLFFASNS